MSDWVAEDMANCRRVEHDDQVRKAYLIEQQDRAFQQISELKARENKLEAREKKLKSKLEK